EKQFCKRWYFDLSSFGINPGKTPGNKRNIPGVTYFHFCQQHPTHAGEKKSRQFQRQALHQGKQRLTIRIEPGRYVAANH
ncbi:hypothetical protein CJZ35_26015, partial [Salmonella enterica subsp. enterica serovar Braenderup]|uniref:hypothetical protein n=1 Tax=Salmonella enterica TaxID=28901 RepID=UPI000BD2712D